MRMMSFNLRGMGGRVKWKFVKNMVIKEEIQLLCLQETKRETINKETCQALWGDHEVE